MATIGASGPPPLAGGWAGAAGAATWFERQSKASDLAWPAIEANRRVAHTGLHEPATLRARTGTRMQWWGRRDSNPRTPRRQDPLPWILSPASPKAAGFLWPGLITPPRRPAGGGDLTVGGGPQIRQGRLPARPRRSPSSARHAESTSRRPLRHAPQSAVPFPLPTHGRPQSRSEPSDGRRKEAIACYYPWPAAIPLRAPGMRV